LQCGSKSFKSRLPTAAAAAKSLLNSPRSLTDLLITEERERER